MRLRIMSGLLLALVALPQATEELFITSEHPRLLLNSRRLKLLRRERVRESIRWQQFQTLMTGGVPMPEPGFANALYYRIADDAEAGRRAVEWALAPQTDLRQLAIVFDWCQPLLDNNQSAAIAARLRAGLDAATGARDLPAVRSAVMAAIALAGHNPDAERLLNELIRKKWQEDLTPKLGAQPVPFPLHETYALYELIHTLRDNTGVDLRDSARAFFKTFPAYHMLAHYPASYPAGENDFRIPVSDAEKEPDLRRASLSRAAELSMVAYDTNAVESQFVQGWLINDRFLMRGPFGAPYEFLWANPYQPGLSYFHMPLVFHDPATGRLILRSSWEEDAQWFGHLEGWTQLFENGRIVKVRTRTKQPPVRMGEATIVFAASGLRFRGGGDNGSELFVVGLTPSREYEIEIDDREMFEQTADAGGILSISISKGAVAGVRIREVAQPGQSPRNRP
ncbi:MAG TPA: hypothetical protein VFQ79_12475 [Bryobacteraceae bacterium]|nr:hypothetical protein [Bryobacteraceae bacterium]